MKIRWIEDALTLDGTLCEREIKQRTTLLAFGVSGFVLSASNTLGTLQAQYEAKSYFVASVVQLIVLMTLVVSILCKRKLTTGVTVVILYTLCATVFVWDLSARTLGRTEWPFLVLAIDLLLALGLPTVYTISLVAFTLTWLMFIAMEETFRFGLLDLPGFIPQDGERSRRYYYDKRGDCDLLPCPVPFPPQGLMRAVAVFFIDFLVTRSFVRDVITEQKAMERTIDTVQEIASLLARYDVEKVAELLEAHRELPEEMTAALRGLEENLRKYRPYLPAALFEEMEEEVLSKHTVAPPGLTTETATIVFTDILSSTSIWEHAPEGMSAALKIHNAVMREVMQMYEGYEVKTIGDAFMVAFSTTQDGVNFGLHVHELLREASWPASLLEDAPICAEQDSLWGGLTVRIGVNTGPVTIEQNTLTGRTDYFGHTVNVASRLESTCKPGAVAVRSDLYTSECRSCDAVVGDAEALDLKGVSGTTFVCCAWPKPLGGRRFSAIRERSWKRDSETKVDSHSSCQSTTSVVQFPLGPVKLFDATTAVVELVVGEEGNPSALRYMSASLSTLTASLDQSRGTLVTLLGNRVCVGWNLTRPSPAHMENAIRFAQRLQIVATLAGAGLVSGPVQHGDVGARKQRFVTVMGRSVHRSWALCDQAVRGGNFCLYEPPLGTVLPPTIEYECDKHPGVYVLRALNEDYD